MSGFLIDTDVISEFVRPMPNSQVIRWLETAAPESLFASVITLGEIRLGIEDLRPANGGRNWSIGWKKMYPHGSNRTSCQSPGRLLNRWAEIYDSGEKKGKPLATADGLIAATALVHNLIVVTRDVGDFAETGVPVFNPWTA